MIEGQNVFLHCCTLHMFNATDSQNKADQIMSDWMIKLHSVHSVHSWKSKQLLATYMQHA